MTPALAAAAEATCAGLRPELVIAVDWSARSTPSPKRPSPDACWIGWCLHDAPSSRRPAPEYFQTRAACEARIADLIASHASPNTGSTLVGFDFPLGYPLARDGTPAMPVGRALCARLDSLIHDDDRNANNRFDVAESLNAQIAECFDEPYGPFWGCPNTRDSSSGLLLPTKRAMHAVPEYRAVENHIRSTRKLQIQSAWKLYTTGSVGSQTLLGLPTLHRLLGVCGNRGRLWPFEPIDRGNAIVFTEIWPSLHDASHIDHPIKDARQVITMRDALLVSTNPFPTTPAPATREGWIAGVQSSDKSDSHTV